MPGITTVSDATNATSAQHHMVSHGIDFFASSPTAT